MTKIYIASDHAGFEMKESIKQVMNNLSFIDLGTKSPESVDYPDYAYALANEVKKDKDALGILICGTGVGMCMAANKVDGIRCANVTSTTFAELAKQHNNANVISLSARYVSVEENVKIINAFLSSTFEERHLQRINKLNIK
ncbi:MAG: RpiB/LacA/LacB family sugar-phosphate isomerase [Mycoplasmoidaceae bacterium]